MFLSPIFLKVLLAAAAPVAIHFLSRQKSKVIPWGAMDFLKESINTTSSRMQRLRDRILLLLRMLAIISVVLAFAQPFISKPIVNTKLETVLIWDISMSTLAHDLDGIMYQERIREALLDKLDDLPDQSVVRILLAGANNRWLKDKPLTLSENNRAILTKLIKKQQVDLGGSSLAKSIFLAINSPSDGDKEKHRNIVVLSDLQEAAWQPEEKDRWMSIKKKVSNDLHLSLEVAEIEEFHIKRGIQAAVVSLETDRDTIATGSKPRFRAILRNYSKQHINNAKVIWLVNGKEVYTKDYLELHPNSDLNVEQVISIESEGTHVVECYLEVPNDPLMADNRAFFVLSATIQLPILIVDDSQKTDEGQLLPSQFIVASLGGHLSEKSEDEIVDQAGMRSVFNASVIRSEDLSRTQLDQQLAVIIVNANSLSPKSIEKVRKFVYSGRGLWLMMGQQGGTLPQWTKQLLKSLDLGSLSRTKLIKSNNKNKPLGLVEVPSNSDYADSISANDLDLHSAELKTLHQLVDKDYLGSEKLLQTPDGDPVILSLDVDPGKVILQMCDLNRNNTNLTILQNFVPIVRHTLWHCVKQEISNRNLAQGDLLRLSNFDSYDDQSSLVVTRPDGTSEQLKKLGGEFQTANTYLPGRYTINGFRDVEGKKVSKVFNVVRNDDESDLKLINQSVLKGLISGKVYSSEGGQEKENEGKWSLALWFAIIAGVFFLTENILAYLIARRRAKAVNVITLKPIY